MLLQIVAVLLIIIFCSIIFAFCGNWLYCKSISDGCSHPVYFRIGTGFFLGMGVFISLWKILYFLSGNTKITLIVTLLVLVIISLMMQKINISLKKINYINIFWIILFVILVFVLKIFLYVESFAAENFSVGTCLGSLHSGKYANIVAYIFESNSIPVLNQNYGQSMLAAVPLIFGFNSPFLALNFWLSVSTIFLCFAFYGFFRMLGLDTIKSIIGVFLLMFANTALSLFPILVIDSGFPWFYNGYTDTIYSIGSFLVFCVLLKKYYENDIKSIFYFLVVSAVICISWNISAAHNIVLGFFALAAVSGVMFFNKRLFKKHIVICFFMVVFVIIGITQGGMLTPKSLRDNVQINGIMTIDGHGRQSDKFICIRPIFPFHHLFNGQWTFGIWDKKREIYSALEMYKKTGQSMQFHPDVLRHELRYETEADFFNSIRMAFFPLVGLILTWFISVFKDSRLDKNGKMADVKKLWFVSFIVFLIDYLIVFFIEFNGYKWELSRFLIPGYVLGMVCFIVSISFLIDNIKGFKVSVIAFIIIFIMTFGQICHGLRNIKLNVFGNTSESVLPFSKRFEMLVFKQKI